MLKSERRLVSYGGKIVRTLNNGTPPTAVAAKTVASTQQKLKVLMHVHPLVSYHSVCFSSLVYEI